MESKKTKHTRSSLTVYIMAGFYLLYIDYSLISNWGEIETSGRKIMVVMVAIGFAIFGAGIITYAAKGLKEIKEEQSNPSGEIEETDEIEND